MTRDARGTRLVAILRHRSADLEDTFRRHRMSQEEALTVLDEAVLEVQLRCARLEDMEARLLRAVARGCTAVLQDRRSARAAQAEAAEVDAD